MKTRKIHILCFSLCLSFFVLLAVPCVWSQEIQVADPEEEAYPCDWISAKGEMTDTELLLAFQTAKPVNLEKGAAYTIFVDTDRNAQTGFRGSSGDYPLGADYLLQGTTLFQYSGSGIDWSWDVREPVPHEMDGCEMSLHIEKALLGNPMEGVDVFFLGDNEAPGVEGSLTDVMPDGALHNGDKIQIPARTENQDRLDTAIPK